MRLKELFHRFAVVTANLLGNVSTFLFAIVLVVIWAFLGPVFNFSDTWQLVINTGTTIITFLAIFLIQNTQNRDSKAIHLKLDELVRSVKGARAGIVDVEELPDEMLEDLHQEFKKLHERYFLELEKRRKSPRESAVKKKSI